MTSRPDAATGATFEQVTACRVCGGADLRAWRTGCRDTMRKTTERRFTYSRCVACRAVLLVDGPTAATVGRFYGTTYAPYLRSNSASLASMFRPDIPRGSSRLLQAQKATYASAAPGRTLVDFGCGTPAVLDVARDAGWRTIGVDFAQEVVQQVRGAGHQGLGVDEFLDAAAPPCDVVRASHVIEHVFDPVRVLQQLRRRLARGGTLHLATPNPDGLASLLFRGAWFGLEAPRHIVLFPPTLLARLVREAGFDDVSVVPEPVTKDLARSAAYLAEAAGVKVGDVSAGDGPRVLNLLARPVVPVASRRGRADRYHVFARVTA